ncbi:MAG: dihydrodipicolinate synthase family protein [Bryobacteraceae bacterium]|nr:dihydrodipicolinate synthase family protein [Bryobacteraceae bacterium]MDW8379210.1 dihydrodipicolinate synthase family protein [Bryobacterales bacterium]
MSAPWRGVFPIVATPFHPDGSIDWESQDRLVEYLLEQGVHGLGLFGNASEAYTLLAEERVELLRRIVKRVNGRVPLIVGSGHTGTDAAVKLSKESEDLGASALMVLPPYLLRPDGDGLMYYFEAISQAVSIPIMVQDAPLMTQVSMPVALLARMGRDIERVKLVKVEAPPTAPKISALRAAAGDGLVLFGGLNGQFLLEELERGAAGTMPNCDIPWMYVEIWKRWTSGDRRGAWDCFTKALPLIRFELQPGLGVSAAKHNMVARGIIRSARVRHPTSSLDDEGLRELETLRKMIEPA